MNFDEYHDTKKDMFRIKYELKTNSRVNQILQ